jgi:hypothetical protein
MESETITQIPMGPQPGKLDFKTEGDTPAGTEVQTPIKQRLGAFQ